MIEIIVKDYLDSVFDDEPTVGFEVPRETPPESFIILEKTGGSEENYIKSATIAIQSYAGSMYDAASLNESVKLAMSGITALNSVSCAKLNADYNFTDETKKKYRYQAIYDLVYFDEGEET